MLFLSLSISCRTPTSSCILLSIGAVSLPYVTIACFAIVLTFILPVIPLCPRYYTSLVEQLPFALQRSRRLISRKIALLDLALLPAWIAANALVLSVKKELPSPSFKACRIAVSSVARTEQVLCLPTEVSWSSMLFRLDCCTIPILASLFL